MTHHIIPAISNALDDVILGNDHPDAQSVMRPTHALWRDVLHVTSAPPPPAPQRTCRHGTVDTFLQEIRHHPPLKTGPGYPVATWANDPHQIKPSAMPKLGHWLAEAYQGLGAAVHVVYTHSGAGPTSTFSALGNPAHSATILAEESTSEDRLGHVVLLITERVNGVHQVHLIDAYAHHRSLAPSTLPTYFEGTSHAIHSVPSTVGRRQHEGDTTCVWWALFHAEVYLRFSKPSHSWKACKYLNDTLDRMHPNTRSALIRRYASFYMARIEQEWLSVLDTPPSPGTLPSPGAFEAFYAS